MLWIDRAIIVNEAQAGLIIEVHTRPAAYLPRHPSLGVLIRYLATLPVFKAIFVHSSRYLAFAGSVSIRYRVGTGSGFNAAETLVFLLW